MRTVSYFHHRGKAVHIYKHHSLGPNGKTFYRAAVDGTDLPVDWDNPEQLEFAIRRVLEEDSTHAQQRKTA
jgi:hypothetical protein